MSQETRRFLGSVTARTLRIAQPGRSLLPVSRLACREEILAGAVATTRRRPRSPARASAGNAMSTILGFDTYDFRFPTSTDLDGSDAMNPSPDYSAAYVVIRTNAADPADSGAVRAGHRGRAVVAGGRPRLLRGPAAGSVRARMADVRLRLAGLHAGGQLRGGGRAGRDLLEPRLSPAEWHAVFCANAIAAHRLTP
jgi:hypothetical protein